MGDKDTKKEENIQASNPPGERPRFCCLSVVAFVLSFPLILFGILFGDWRACCCFVILLLVTLTLGIAALIQIKLSDGKLRGKWFATFAIIVAGLTFFGCLIWFFTHFRPIPP